MLKDADMVDPPAGIFIRSCAQSPITRTNNHHDRLRIPRIQAASPAMCADCWLRSTSGGASLDFLPTSTAFTLPLFPNPVAWNCQFHPIPFAILPLVLSFDASPSLYRRFRFMF
ncbi:unnamed protein product [Strongylus vulgaris]|uniref:Uncharacterized protein n=1 Tax=Strongylus vulgaris TaxID=40348 RepID=A0A3P7KBW4_STRVU|nr:unnamed protein product [Strongylus vulgaris]